MKLQKKQAFDLSLQDTIVTDGGDMLNVLRIERDGVRLAVTVENVDGRASVRHYSTEDVVRILFVG